VSQSLFTSITSFYCATSTSRMSYRSASGKKRLRSTGTPPSPLHYILHTTLLPIPKDLSPSATSYTKTTEAHHHSTDRFFRSFGLVTLGILIATFANTFGLKFLFRHFDNVNCGASMSRAGLGWFYARQLRREQAAQEVHDGEARLPQLGLGL